MKNKILKVGMCALLAASFLTGCAEESTQTDVDLNSMTIEEITEKAKEDGYVETLFHRRRYVPEINSNNYMVRQFGNRIAMNTPIQGTAADIMKLAMINIYNRLNEKNLESKIILQVHDELLIEAKPEEKQEVEEILKQEMENVISLKVPLKIDIEEGKSLYDAK